MRLKRSIAFAAGVLVGAASLWANPPPSQPISPDNRPYSGPIAVGGAFPAANYGLNHTGSSFTVSYETGPYGGTDRSRGTLTYYSAPFFPRNSEGVFGMDLWLQKQESDVRGARCRGLVTRT